MTNHDDFNIKTKSNETDQSVVVCDVHNVVKALCGIGKVLCDISNSLNGIHRELKRHNDASEFVALHEAFGRNETRGDE